MKVFITHGHNEIAKLKIKDFLATHLTHEPVILGEQPGRQGMTIIEALEKFSEGCEFAVILLTGDDMTKDGGLRARQNVIHEIGFFQGRLGRSKVVLIVQEGVEIPSNLSGLFYLQYKNDIEEVFINLEAILKAGDASASAKKLDTNSLVQFTEQMGSMDQSWIRSISKELEPYVELPPKNFFVAVSPILKKHGDGYARQAEYFRSDAVAPRENPKSGDKSKDDAEVLGPVIAFAKTMLIGPSDRLADMCHNAVTIMEDADAKPEDQQRAKTVVLRMFGLVA